MQPRLPGTGEQRALLRVAATAPLLAGSLVPRRAHCPAGQTTVGTAPVAPRSSECRSARRSSGRRGGLGAGRRKCRSSENRRAGRPYHQTNAAAGAALPPLLRIPFPGAPEPLCGPPARMGQGVERSSPASGRGNRVRSTTTRKPGRELSQIAVAPVDEIRGVSARGRALAPVRRRDRE